MRSWVAFCVSASLLAVGVWSCVVSLWHWLTLPVEAFPAELSVALAELGYEPTGDLSRFYGLMTLADLRLRDTYWAALTLLGTGFSVGACEAALSAGRALPPQLCRLSADRNEFWLGLFVSRLGGHVDTR